MKGFRQNAILILVSVLFSLTLGFEAFSFLHTSSEAKSFPAEISKEEALSASDQIATIPAIFDIRRIQSSFRSGTRESDDLGQIYTFPIKKRFTLHKGIRFSQNKIFFLRSKDYFVFTLERILC